MKNHLTILFCSLVVICSSFTFDKIENKNDEEGFNTEGEDKSYYYYYKGERKYLELNTKYIFVSSHQPQGIQESRFNSLARFSSLSTVKEDILSQLLKKPRGFFNKTSIRYWAELEIKSSSKHENYLKQLDDIRRMTNLLVSPYFKGKSGERIGLTNYLYVKLKNEHDFHMLMEQAEKYKVDLIGYNKFMPLWFTFSTTQESDDAMQVANMFYESGLFEHAEPDLIVDVKLNSQVSGTGMSSNDPLFPEQWSLKNTGQHGGVAGIDVKAEPAWQISTGNHSTLVAVFDQGVPLDHPDLAANIIGSYNSETGTIPSGVYDTHGAKSAGVLGAIGNNNLGISGVAPNIGLLSVSNTLFLSTPGQKGKIADGLNWSWQNGAAVISNSWSSDELLSHLIDDAISMALESGRDGLGTVVVFSSGNDNVNGAQYPGNSNPKILCVGGIDRCGFRSGGSNAVSQSCDLWYLPDQGSSYGAPLDLVAGGSVIMTTTVNSTYDPLFGGTSAACPMVAGVAGLILSVKPALTAIQVNNIIEQTAQKIRPDKYAYEQHNLRSNGNWNNEVGYGLVDAHQALLLAQTYDQLVCSDHYEITEVIVNGIYTAVKTISSTAVINPNLDLVEFHAGNSITLEPGFSANAYDGYYFEAEINECFNITNMLNTTVDENVYFIEKTNQENTATFRMPEFTKLDKSLDSNVFKNYPNPFSDITRFDLTLQEPELISLYVNDVNGKLISIIQETKVFGVGNHQFSFDGGAFQAGIYYYTLQIGADLKTGKLCLIR